MYGYKIYHGVNVLMKKDSAYQPAKEHKLYSYHKECETSSGRSPKTNKHKWLNEGEINGIKLSSITWMSTDKPKKRAKSWTNQVKQSRLLNTIAGHKRFVYLTKSDNQIRQIQNKYRRAGKKFFYSTEIPKSLSKSSASSASTLATSSIGPSKVDWPSTVTYGEQIADVNF